jgi:hypothetical protein
LIFGAAPRCSVSFGKTYSGAAALLRSFDPPLELLAVAFLDRIHHVFCADHVVPDV